MRKKRILLSLLVCLTAFFAGIFSACAAERSKVEELRKDGYVEITYDAGEAGSFAHGRYAYFMVPEGSQTVEPDTEAKESEEAKKFRAPQREKYDLVGWYLQKSDGTLSEEHFDFSTPITEDVVLVADWQARYYFYFATETGEKIDEDNRIWVTGEGAVATVNAAPKRKGYTLLGYYKDAACTIPLEKNAEGKYVTPAHSANTEDLIYTKWLEGEYAFVSTAKEFVDAVKAGKGVYLMNDIDFTGVEWYQRVIYSGNIAGNGYKVSNVTYSYQATKGSYQFGLFGKFSGKASDVTFENCTLSFTAPKTQSNGSIYSVGFLCGTLGAEGVVENVTFTNCSISVDATPLQYGFLVQMTEANIAGSVEENATIGTVTGTILDDYH